MHTRRRKREFLVIRVRGCRRSAYLDQRIAPLNIVLQKKAHRQDTPKLMLYLSLLVIQFRGAYGG